MNCRVFHGQSLLPLCNICQQRLDLSVFTNITLGQKRLALTNPLAYSTEVLITAVKKFTVQAALMKLNMKNCQHSLWMKVAFFIHIQSTVTTMDILHLIAQQPTIVYKSYFISSIFKDVLTAEVTLVNHCKNI